MAGQLAVTARKSIPVENRSSRLFSAAGVGALVIATSQWAHWAGYADWDLLSLIPGFAQVTGLLPNAYADGRVFDCPNKTLGAEIALMSDDMLQTVGKTLCTKEELIAASLRGSDGRPRLQSAALVTQSPESIILPIMSVIVPPPRMTTALPVAPATPAARPFTLASIEPVRRDPNRDLIEAINRRARQVEDVDPCAGAKSLAGCEFENPGSGSGGSSDGGSSGPGSGSGGDGSGIDGEDHSGSGGDGSSGSGGDGNDWSDNGGSGGGSDGGEGGESGGGSHDGGEDHADSGGSHGGDGGESHGGDGGDSHGGDSGDSHEGSNDGGESDGGGSHDGGDTHEIADNSDGGDSGGHSSNDSGDDHLESGGGEDHSGASGGGDHEDHDSSHSGGDGGEGGEGGSSGRSGSGRSGGRG